MGYSQIAEACGEVLATSDDGNGYQGTHYYMVRRVVDGLSMYKVIACSYGTCSFCDTYQSVRDTPYDTDMTWEEREKLADAQWERYVAECKDAIIHSVWFKTVQQALDAEFPSDEMSYWHDESNLADLKNQLKAYL